MCKRHKEFKAADDELPLEIKLLVVSVANVAASVDMGGGCGGGVAAAMQTAMAKLSNIVCRTKVW